MMSNNGHHNLDWLDQARVYAALAEAEDLSEAEILLAREGLTLHQRRLAGYRRRGRQKVERMRDSGLAPQLLGLATRQGARVQRVDALCRSLEDRLRTEEMALDRDLASVLQQYRELMELLATMEGACATDESPEPSGTEPQVAATLTLLEALHHEDSPRGDFARDVYDAGRRLAAATGHAFAPPDADQPPLAADDGGL
jgi:hypothetical protein